MTIRYVLAAAATLVAVSVSGALAADMPEGPPPVVYAPPDTAVGCGLSGRHADRLWRPGQVAYIVAQTCGGVPANWINLIGIQRREDVFVYYNGGSMDRPDVTSINVPYQSQLH